MRTFGKRLLLSVLRGLGLWTRARASQPAPASVRLITVIRFGGIGDMIVATGLLQSLRRAYPQARLRVVTNALHAPIVRNLCENLEVLVVDRLAWGEPLRPLLRRLALVNRERSDLCFFLHNDLESLVLAPFIRAHQKIGAELHAGFAFGLHHRVSFFLDPNQPPRPEERADEDLNDFFHEHLWLVYPLARFPASPPHLPARKASPAVAFALAPLQGQTLVGLAVTGTFGNKHWPVASYSTLAESLLQQRNLAVVILGGPAEKKHAQRFPSSPRLWFSAGDLSLDETFATVAQCHVVIGGDTGLIHAAHALSRPTIALFGPTSTQAYGYTDDRHLIIQDDLPCIPCHRPDCRLKPAADWQRDYAPCMENISVDRVLHSALRLLT